MIILSLIIKKLKGNQNWLATVREEYKGLILLSNNWKRHFSIKS